MIDPDYGVHGQTLTRFGVRVILQKQLSRAVQRSPSLRGKRLHPHTLRHSTGIHLLRSGVGLSTIANWLGARELDLETKRAALVKAKPILARNHRNGGWRTLLTEVALAGIQSRLVDIQPALSHRHIAAVAGAVTSSMIRRSDNDRNRSSGLVAARVYRELAIDTEASVTDRWE